MKAFLAGGLCLGLSFPGYGSEKTLFETLELSPWKDLPREVQKEVWAYFTVPDFQEMCCVSKTWCFHIKPVLLKVAVFRPRTQEQLNLLTDAFLSKTPLQNLDLSGKKHCLTDPEPNRISLEMLEKILLPSDLTHSLRYLRLTHKQLSTSGIEAMGIHHLTQLETLKLRGNTLDDAFLDHLIKIPHLTNLDLSFNKMSGEGVTLLSQMTTLRHLDLFANKIGDHGVSPLKSLTQLVSLRLDSNGISDEGADHVTSMTHLRELTMEFNPISIGKAEEIFAKCPWLTRVRF